MSRTRQCEASQSSDVTNTTPAPVRFVSASEDLAGSAIKLGVFMVDGGRDGNLYGRPPIQKNDLAGLAQLSHHCNSLFQPILNERALIQLAQHVINNDHDKVNEMLNIINPQLLTMKLNSANREHKSTILWPARKSVSRRGNAGKVINKMTILQVALCDLNVELVEMIKPHFAKLENGQEEFERQCQQICPEGIEKYLAEQTPYDFSELIDAFETSTDLEIADALNKVDNASKINLAIKKFNAEFEELSYSEKVFNPQHLAKAYEIYAKKYAEWDGDDNRQDLLWQRLMGKAQDLSPMRWKQAVCQLWALTEKNPPDKFKPVKTIYNYITEKDIALLDLVEDPNCSLSSDFAIYGWPEGDACATRAGGCGAARVLFFQSLCRAHTSSLGKLMQRESNRPAPPGCLIQ